MKNKVLVQINVAKLNVTYDVFVPVNEVIWKIKKLALKAIADINQISLDIDKNWIVMNKDNCNIYNNNDILINTDIRNGSSLLFILLD